MTATQYQISSTLESAEMKLRMAQEDLDEATMRIRQAMNQERFDLVAQYATLAQAAQEKVETLRNLVALLDDCRQAMAQVA